MPRWCSSKLQLSTKPISFCPQKSFICAFAASFRSLSKLVFIVILEKKNLVSGDKSRHSRCTFLHVLSAHLVRILGGSPIFPRLFLLLLLVNLFTFTVCSFESPLSYVLLSIEFPATKIFRLIWLLIDCCFGDLMFGPLFFNNVAAFTWEVSVTLSPVVP